MYVCLMFLTHSMLWCVVVNEVQINALIMMLEKSVPPLPKLRVLVVTSPPWGAFPNEAHDVALNLAQIKV
jgi:hypothetical protein